VDSVVSFSAMRRYTADHRMTDESTRNWTITYIAVVVVEAAVLAALFWLQQHFKV
jgi:hypothetical protein